MNKFLLASLGLAVIASGVVFGADSTPQAAPVPVNLVDLEANLNKLGVPADLLSTTNVVDKASMLQNLEKAQAEAAKSGWTKGKIAGAVVTGLVVTGALIAVANQKGYTPKALQPYLNTASSSLVSGVQAARGWLDAKTAGVTSVVRSGASTVGSAASYVGSKASDLGSAVKGATSNATGRVSAGFSSLGSTFKGWFTKATPAAAPVVAPVVPQTRYSAFNNPPSAAFAS